MNEFFLIMPEVLIILTLAFVLFGELFYSGEERRLIIPTAVMGLAGAFVQTLLTYQQQATQIFGNTFSVDGLSLFFKLLFIVLSGLSIVSASQSRELIKERRTEYIALILASTLGMCLAASATDLVLAFLAIQCVNILGYFIAGQGKNSIFSIEAAVKLMIFSAASGAFFLYGAALLFSATHTLNIYEMHEALVKVPLSHGSALIIFMMIFLSLSFQVAAFPMHFWAPDVIEGMPTPASSFLSIGTRAAGIAVALRVLIGVFAKADSAGGQWQAMDALDWTQIVALISGITMVVGSLLAFRQKAAKRMVGCLIVAQSGFLLLGLLVLDQVGVSALLYSLVIELFAVVGIFYVLSYFVDQVGSDQFSGLGGMMGRAVPESMCLVFFLLSLVGVPPSPGFIGKFGLIQAVMSHHWVFLGIIAIFSMAISTIAVARFVYALSGDLRLTLNSPLPSSKSRKIFLVALLSPIAIAGIWAQGLLDWVGKSLNFIFW